MTQKKDDKYTDPELREKIKEKVKEGDKGGQPGQWSARKAQMMAAEYKKAAHEKGEEPYKTDKKDEKAKSLTNWTKEEWQTSDGSGNAKQADGTERRYLPKKAWENMTDEEKRETEKAKEAGSKEGKQFVANTKKAASSRAKAQQHSDDDGEEEKEEKSDEGETKRKRPTRGAKKTAEEKDTKRQKTATPKKTAKKAAEDKEQSSEEKSADEEKEDDKKPPKKGTSKKDKPSEPAGSVDRLPKSGQTVSFHALPGWVEGSVIRVLTSATTVNGKKVNASKEDPRILIKSHGATGKQCVHKPDNVYF